MQFSHSSPVKLVFGPGRLDALATEPLPGTKALLLTSNGTAVERIGALGRVKTMLEARGVPYVHVAAVEPNPLSTTVMAVSKTVREEKCDFIIALGGGSVMDAAKAIGIVATNDGDIWDYVQQGRGGRRPIENAPIPLVAITTTAGTESLRLLRLFGNTTSKKVTPSVGPEQEYFIVDREKYLQRKDLIFTGRTLFGAMPPKGQEMDDHYFGVIRERIGSYMNDLNKELWKLGVPAKTQHNEVAPAQHELAPIYEGVNQSVDHNQIVMETMKKVAERHGLACLLHEKPFAGVNGSGKHNNWSLTADDGTNLMNPGDTPHENIQFLLVLACIIKAVDIHADLLRESASNVGNDHRLGANEAPPAIISIFLGEQLEDVIDQLCDTGEATHSKQGGTLKTGVDILPDFDKDATDRNRTSPFAFTGNKFEFRMVGSSDSIASANTVLNTIIAEAFKEAADKLEKADNFDMAVHDMIKETLAAHKRVVFNGNGYSDEWVAEAERRGLPNIKSMVDAIPALITDKAVKLFEEFGVFTKTELESRVEVEYEGYAKAINIEAKTMIDMAGKQIIPAVIKYTTALAASISAVKSACPEADVSTQTELLLETSDLLAETKLALAKLTEITEKSAAMDGGKDQAVAYHEEVVPAMAALRTPVDKLEMLVDKDLWPMPSYGDLIFEV